MASEVKALLQEKTEDRHEIFCRSLTGEFQNLSPVWEAQAGFLDSKQPKFKDVWWVFYLDKQFCDKVKEVMTLPLSVPLSAPAAALLCLEQWVDVKANVAASDGKQEAWKGGDLWSGGDS